MKHAKVALQGMCADAVFAALLYAGFWLGHEIAANLAVFVAWIIGIGHLIAGIGWPLLPDTSKLKMKREDLLNHGAWRVYDIATDVAFVLALAIVGHIATAVMLGIGTLVLKSMMYEWSSRRDRARRATVTALDRARRARAEAEQTRDA